MPGPDLTAEQSSKTVEEYMTETVHEVCDAVNNRDFTYKYNTEDERHDVDTHPVWSRFAVDFHAEPEYISSAATQGYQQPLPLKVSQEEKVAVEGREQVQEMFRRIADAYPSYRLTASDISTTVHEKARWATSYVSMDTYDMPPGVVRHSVGVFEWKLINGKWLMCKYEGMAGMNSE